MKKVFIGGCDRSGTTFLAGLLSKYQGVVVGPETQFKRDISKADLANFDKNVVLDKFILNWRFGEWFSDMRAIRAEVARANIGSYEELVDFLVRLFSIEKFGFEPSVWVDHTPENFEFYNIYSTELTDVKYIHIYRDGRAVASSLMSLEWGPNTSEAAAKFWLEKLSYPFAVQSISKDSVLAVSYESLVLNTDKEVNRIIQYCGISSSEYDRDACIFMPGFTLDQHQLVGKEVSSDRINSWESKLDQQAISIFEFYAGGMLELLGYQLVGSEDISKVHQLKDRVYEAIFSQLNKFKYRRKRGI